MPAWTLIKRGWAAFRTSDGGLAHRRHRRRRGRWRADQDRLGLQRIYVQARRYAADNPVGRQAIEAFVRALHGRNVSQGVFISTSRFTPGAAEYAASIGARIVLTDGVDWQS